MHRRKYISDSIGGKLHLRFGRKGDSGVGPKAAPDPRDSSRKGSSPESSPVRDGRRNLQRLLRYGR